jgi:class 3 adenylate cyclase/DNA-binding winged helix-turn-helix (wHTH) protein
MTLAQRLSGFISWPISRKLFLLGSGGSLATLLALVVTEVTFSSVRVGAMHLDVLFDYFVLWLVAQVTLSIAAYQAMRGGTQGRWAAYLFVTVQAPFIVGLLHLFGTMGTPLVAIYPAIVILWILMTDERIGLFGCLNLVGWIAVIGALETTGALPYAPVLVERTIDAQNDPVWFWTMFFNILVLLGVCVSLCVLFQRTRLRQDAELRLTHVELEEANRLIRRYVPAQLADAITSGRYVEAAKPERRKLTIVSIGIEDFALAAEELEAEDLAAVLSEYVSEMFAIADRHEGSVNHVAGDGILILFGAPHVTDDRDHALRAIRLAEDVHDRVAAMRNTWANHGLDKPFQIRIGINTGYISVGDFGTAGRKLYSAVGLQTNIAERIQAECPAGEVLLSHTTWALVHDVIASGPHGEIQVTGLAHPLRLYALARDGVQAPASGAHSVSDSGGVWSFGDVRFDESRLQLSIAGQAVDLERKPLEVLRYLLRHAGQVVTKDELLVAIWPGRVLSETVVAKSVSRLREVLRDEDQLLIKTVHGYGYLLAAEITSAPLISPAPAR